MIASTEAASKADFSLLRYAQCWEDADVLLEGLAIQPGDVCLSIASAGDNALAMLARSPARVIAVDLSFAQIAAVRLRIAAYQELEHQELLEFLGYRPCADRAAFYRRLTGRLEPDVRAYWDAHPDAIAAGAANCGKFDDYFRLFRTRVLPLVHAQRTVRELLAPRSRDQRVLFYRNRWNSWRWRALFRLFFSRFVMGRLGRDPAFFDYVDGSVAERILRRAEHALVELDPSANSYRQRILCGEHAHELPFALRAENFEAIRRNITRLETYHGSIEACLDAEPAVRFDRFNLSDIFEYMSEENYAALLGRLASASNPGARLLYWNMLAPRSRPASMAAQLVPLDELAQTLHAKDNAFFYSRLLIEQVA
jgi:S-adenosylmethionine-diacylglycerol 3-amino-3-carboxypropyl transferase